MIYLRENTGKPLYEQLYEILKNDILHGALRANQALRPIRSMAEELNVSNNTVSRAYSTLMSEGYVRAVSGSGYYVEDIGCLLGPDAPPGRQPRPRYGPGPKRRSALKYDFEYACIDSALFPWNKWRQYLLDAVSLESYKSTIGYECNKGNEALRISLCRYLHENRGIDCRPEHIVVCAGTQYGLDIIMNILKITRIAFEEPGYDAVRKLFLAKGCEIVPIPLTSDGIDYEILATLKDGPDLDVLYITPSHQFPTGITTSMAERLMLLQLARDNNMYIIENDYDNEFSHGKKRLPALRSLSSEKVIYLSTLSKVLSPSLRCAYFVLPDHLMFIYDDLYKHYNAALPSCIQIALSNFINDGYLDKHLRKVSTLNKRRHEIFIANMKKSLADRIAMYNSPAGSHVLVKIHGCRNQAELISALRERSIGIYGTKEYWHIKEQASEDIFLFGYSSMSEEKISGACQALAAALRDLI